MNVRVRTQTRAEGSGMRMRTHDTRNGMGRDGAYNERLLRAGLVPLGFNLSV